MSTQSISTAVLYLPISVTVTSHLSSRASTGGVNIVLKTCFLSLAFSKRGYTETSTCLSHSAFTIFQVLPSFRLLPFRRPATLTCSPPPWAYTLRRLHLQQDQDLAQDVSNFAKHATNKATSPTLSYLTLGISFAVHQCLHLDISTCTWTMVDRRVALQRTPMQGAVSMRSFSTFG